MYAYTFAAPQLPQDKQAVTATGPAKVIDVKDAASHLNENVTITAKVYGSRDFSSMILVNEQRCLPG